jgi:GT2 family glycosyltransferase
VVIVSWNTQALLRECISSALAAARQLNRPVEVIVVDNASADGSPAMVRQEFPAVRIISNETNRGFAAATNQGLCESRGRYLLLLNPDTKSTSDFLGVLIAFLESHPGAGAVAPRLLGADGEQQLSCYPLPTLPRELWRLLQLDRFYAFGTYSARRFRTSLPQRVDIILGACMLIRREALEQTGLLDEQFFIYTEEVDLCRRLYDAGWEIFWVPDAVIVHYGGASTSQVATRMFLELYRSKVQYFRKHLGTFGSVAYKSVLLASTLPRLILPALLMAFIPSQRPKSRLLLKNYSHLLIRVFAF